MIHNFIPLLRIKHLDSMHVDWQHNFIWDKSAPECGIELVISTWLPRTAFTSTVLITFFLDRSICLVVIWGSWVRDFMLDMPLTSNFLHKCHLWCLSHCLSPFSHNVVVTEHQVVPSQSCQEFNLDVFNAVRKKFFFLKILLLNFFSPILRFPWFWVLIMSV